MRAELPRIFILGDGQGWVVDRCVDEMVSRIPANFTRASYTKIPPKELVEQANKADLTYYSNWDLSYHLDVLDQIEKPFLFSIRSHRYPSYVPKLAERFHTHVINKDLLNDFPNATYIPDGIFDGFYPDHVFRVGMAFQEQSREYKGYYLVKQACDELGCQLKVATNLSSRLMRQFYETVDVMIVASQNEGHNTIAMECMYMNKPVITTDVGIPKLLNVHKCERNVESIKEAISKFYTHPQVKDYSWDSVCKQFTKLFESLI